MWFLLVPLISLAVFVSGIVLIARYKKRGRGLWLGIGLVSLFVLTLPLTLPFLYLAILLVTGGSFN